MKIAVCVVAAVMLGLIPNAAADDPGPLDELPGSEIVPEPHELPIPTDPANQQVPNSGEEEFDDVVGELLAARDRLRDQAEDQGEKCLDHHQYERPSYPPEEAVTADVVVDDDRVTVTITIEILDEVSVFTLNGACFDEYVYGDPGTDPEDDGEPGEGDGGSGGGSGGG